MGPRLTVLFRVPRCARTVIFLPTVADPVPPGPSSAPSSALTFDADDLDAGSRVRSEADDDEDALKAEQEANKKAAEEKREAFQAEQGKILSAKKQYVQD